MASFLIDVRHRTCEIIDEDDDLPPIMELERAEDDMGIFTCIRCHEKISILMFFQKE